MALKRIDFATAPPSLDKLPEGYEDDDDEEERDGISVNSSSADDLDDGGAGAHATNGSGGSNDDHSHSAHTGSLGKKGGLSSLQHAAASRPPPSRSAGSNSAAPNGAFGRWLSQRNHTTTLNSSGNPVDEESDPDRHYFSRGLGRLDDIDGNASAEEDDDYEDYAGHHHHSHLHKAQRPLLPENNESAGKTSTLLTLDGEPGSPGEVRFAGGTARPQQQQQHSYDIRASRHNAYGGGGSLIASDVGSDSELESEDDHPEAEARFEWQHMLSNVLQGEVLKSEKTRISGSLTNDLDDTSNTRKWRAYQIWLRLRAHVRGRTVQQEVDYLEEARAQIETMWNEVANFRIGEEEKAENENPRNPEHPDSTEQIAMMVRKIEWCDCLYPSVRALYNEKAHVADKRTIARIDALISWQTISKRLKTQISILQKWTGSNDLEVTQPGTESVDEAATPAINTNPAQRPIHRLLDTSPFIERIFKEDTLQKTFEKSTIADLYRLVHDAKSVMISSGEHFTEMNLPTFYHDIIALVNFPTNLIQEALKLRLNYVQHLQNENQPSVVLVDQLTADFRSGLALAAKLKENFLEIMTPNPGQGWPGGSLHEEYDKVLLDSLRFFFKLLNWKLKSGSKAIYLKETEIVENEWKFLSEAVEQIEGGDLLVGEHFCTLTHRLLMRVTSYFEEQLQVLGERNMSAAEMSRWFNQTLDNVRLRHRKLLRFGRAMQQRFENSAEYLLDDVSLNAFIHALAETEHFLVYTGHLEAQAIYVIASSTLSDRPDLLHQMLTKSFASHSQADFADGETPPEVPHYLLVLSPHEPFIWTGGVLNLETLPSADYDMREGRVRLVADGPMGRLARCKNIFYDLFPAFRDQVIVEQKAHLGRINRELKKIKRSEFKLAESILTSVERVHKVLRSTPGSEAALANYFSFTADLGQRSLKHMEPALRSRFSMSLMRFSIEWVAFICDDCVPSDSRTFKWAVAALEFAMLMTRNENILRLSPEEFDLLRAKVASCMTLLISHFDILGARSSFEAKKEKERMDVAREEVRKQLQATIRYLNSVEHIRRHGDHRFASDVADAALYFDDQEMLESVTKVRENWLVSLSRLEQKRIELESGMRVVGRVLDEERPEDQSLLFLATSNSNISIRWQQGKFIGGGSFGSVYLAVNLDSGGLMAVKEIKFQDLSSAPHLIKQIRDEMQVMEMLSHPNIVDYYGIEVHRDKVYIFEEYCQGGSLANLLEHGRIEDESVIQIYTVQLLDGLMYLHSMGVVHRDIKPDNILLDHMGVIKYVDFGAAKVLAKNHKTMVAKTRAPAPGGQMNSLTGTPMYMSPEVIKGDHRGRRGAMDVWSLGCVVLECATGRRPWSNLDNEWAIMFQIGIATNHPPLPDKSELSELGIDFIECCLDIDPMKRPSAEELMEHPWIQQFSAAIAQEMRMTEEMNAGSGGTGSQAEWNRAAIHTIGEEGGEEYEDQEYEAEGIQEADAEFREFQQASHHTEDFAHIPAQSVQERQPETPSTGEEQPDGLDQATPDIATQ